MNKLKEFVSIQNVPKISVTAKIIAYLTSGIILMVAIYIAYFYIRTKTLCFGLEWGILLFCLFEGLFLTGMMNLWFLLNSTSVEKMLIIDLLIMAFFALSTISSVINFLDSKESLLFSLMGLYASSRFIYKNEKKFANKWKKENSH